MSAADLFGMWAVTAAVAEARGVPPRTGVAIGDYEPAAAASASATSPQAQMRALLAGSRGVVTQWLAVSVPREANRVVDRLSHPDELAA
eukprot:857038-Pleurochrysis_carterae.AAC.1